MTQSARRRLRRSRGSVGKKILLAFGALLGLIGIGVASVGLWVLDVRASAPSIDSLKPIDQGYSSEVFAADGTSLGFIDSDAVREEVGISEIPKSLQQATVAIEDENFYEHDGVDYGAVLRAAIENVEAGFEIKQGGSTITQQLVRNLYLEDPEDTIERKIIEGKLAEELEEQRSKRWILGEYLNTASYGTNDGRTAVGVEAASQVYFNKHVSELDLDEAALLAGLPQAPSEYNPFLSPEAAKARRNAVLQRMYEEAYIDAFERDQALQDGLGLERGYRYEQKRERFFFDYVEQQLIDEYGVNTVRQGGLEVHTTIDPQLQAAAEAAIVAHPTTGAANALVSTDTETGEILAMASSSAYDSSQFNLAAQGARQPGSAFKPFVLTTAVDQGIDPDATYYNGPSTITLDICDDSGVYCESWSVSGGGGTMSLRQATANSINTIFAQLGLDVGPENFADMAKRMGITSELQGYAAEAIGGTSTCCSVLEMSNAYATIASGGVHHDPVAISRVEFPDGEVDEPEDTDGRRVLSDGVAYEVADVMTGTLDYGTADGNDISCPAAGKTGTTEEQSDAWFVGFTPHISTAVWTGNPDARVPLPGYGAQLSAPIWHDFMTVAASEPCDDFPEPENPAQLSSYYSEHTVDPNYEPYEPTTPEDTDDRRGGDDATTPETGGDTNGYDPDLYAPGAGQDAAPSPNPGGGGGNQGGGGPASGGTGG
ncbi:MAG TPA: transglycosylase domain-containing protein [Solirubrobacterales bacterium]|nr:transglycosylase domain-containing protein [Solirubrobacterales bacterium]